MNSFFKAGTVIAGICLCLGHPGAAQQTDETDLSRYEIFEKGEDALTLNEIQMMEDRYLADIEAGNCVDGLPKIVEFYNAANKTSNLIRRGNEPYYDARRDDQKKVAADRGLLNELVAAERAFNSLIRQRNKAWVEEAKCLIATGEKNEAVIRLYRALDYISVDERELWAQARTLLWDQVGFKNK